MLQSGMTWFTVKFVYGGKSSTIFTRAKTSEQALELFKEGWANEVPTATVTKTVLQDFLDEVNKTWEEDDEFELVPHSGC